MFLCKFIGIQKKSKKMWLSLIFSKKTDKKYVFFTFSMPISLHRNTLKSRSIRHSTEHFFSLSDDYNYKNFCGFFRRWKSMLWHLKNIFFKCCEFSTCNAFDREFHGLSKSLFVFHRAITSVEKNKKTWCPKLFPLTFCVSYDTSLHVTEILSIDIPVVII